MKTIKLLAAVCALALPISAFAGGSASGTVTHLFVTASFGNIVYVQLSGTKSGNPACSTRTPWQFAIPVGAAAVYPDILALVIAAHQTGASITIAGQGQCNVDNSEETILSAEL